MYLPKNFENTDTKAIAEFIHKNSFAILTSIVDGKPWGTHLPLELTIDETGKWFLHGHLSRANLQAKSFQDGIEVLAIFNGPHAYVSSGWYNHANVPTWNYIAVHLSGKLMVSSDEDLYKHLSRLTAHHEIGMEKPQDVSTMPPEMVKAQMKGIIGFAIEVTEIKGKWKLSQNRNDEDFSRVILELEKLDAYDSKLIAEEMKKLR